MYENALNLDPRHYNAWHRPQEPQEPPPGKCCASCRWGLGNIYHRQEEHEKLDGECGWELHSMQQEISTAQRYRGSADRLLADLNCFFWAGRLQQANLA